MTREEENKILLDAFNKMENIAVTGDYEQLVPWELGAITTCLLDISKSLAIIADKVESEADNGYKDRKEG